MIKTKEEWVDGNKEYYYIEYYGSDNKYNYYWWDDDYIRNEKLIETLNRKRDEYCKDPKHAWRIEWDYKVTDNGDMD
jgi:hypothetical protein